MSDLDTCDYCNREVSSYAYLRAVGFSEEREGRLVRVKVHCGCDDCQPPDDIDPEAAAELRADLLTFP